MGASNIKQDIKTNVLTNQQASRRGTNKPLEQMRSKLIKAKPELKQSPNELEELATTLLVKDKIKEKYFGHLLKRKDKALNTTREEKEAFVDGLQNEAERRECVERIETDLNSIKQLHVKIVLFEINENPFKCQVAKFTNKHIHQFAFGPFHAAIHIGDLLLDWGPSSVIIPSVFEQPLHEASFSPILVADVHEKDPAVETSASELEVRAGSEATQQVFDKTIKEIVQLGANSELLIDELASVIVRYNSKFHYGLFSNNCQHFVVDVLSVLGITKHMEAFKGKLKEHAAVLLERGDSETSEFNNHQELDDHVHQNIDQMGRDDLEFAYCHYLLFHAWGKKYDREPGWTCDPDRCMCDELSKRLQ